MTPHQFRKSFERWLTLLHYCRLVNDQGGQARCERELERLSEYGAKGSDTTNDKGAR